MPSYALQAEPRKVILFVLDSLRDMTDEENLFTKLQETEPKNVMLAHLQTELPSYSPINANSFFTGVPPSTKDMWFF
jgi:hypothetical protein